MNFDALIEAATAARILATNIRTLDLPAFTRKLVEEAASRATVIRLNDGTPVLAADGTFLDTPMPTGDLQATLLGLSESMLFVVFGVGMGHVARTLTRFTRVPVIIYEPDPGLLRSVLESSPLDLAEIPIVCNQSDLAVVWSRFASERRQPIVVSTPGYRTLFPKECEALTEAVRRLAERVTITKNTYRKRARVWVDDIIENIELLGEHPPALVLEGQFRGVPAFVIGAGPSLDKNIHLLKDAVRKGLVFASNSSALALAKLGIVPQFLVCIESIDISERLKTIPFLDQTIRMFSLTANPKTLRTGAGPLLPFYEALPQYGLPLEELLGVTGIGVCGSVSTAAFSIAQKFGCSPVTLVGQDMAFTAGRTYAGGTGYESSRADFDTEKGCIKLSWNDAIQQLHGDLHGKRHDVEPLMPVPAWGGGTVNSGASFMAVHSWLEGSVAVNLKFNPNARFINATEGGASVKGFTEQPLAEVLADMPDLDITVPKIVELSRMHGRSRTADELRRWVSQQQELTHQTKLRAHRTRRLGRHALSTIRRDQPTDIARAFSALDKAEDALRGAIARSPLIDAFSHAAVEDLMNEHSRETVDARKDAEAAVSLGTDVAFAIERASMDLENTLAKLSQRL